MDYFNSELVRFKGDWKVMLSNHLLEGPQPLLTGLVGGFGHPLILLADAFELQSPELAAEALALNAIDYNDIHKFLSMPRGMHTPKPTLLPAELLAKIAVDHRFDNLVTTPGVQNTNKVLAGLEARTAAMEYLLALDVSDIPALLNYLSDLAILLQGAAQKPEEPAFDFYLNHALTFVYCLKVLLPVFPEKEHTLTLVRVVWLLIMLGYVTEMRPILTSSLVRDVEIGENVTWETVFAEFNEDERLTGKYLDAHFLRGLRNLMELGKARKENEIFYIKAAVKLKHQWDGWTGFGKDGELKLNVRG